MIKLKSLIEWDIRVLVLNEIFNRKILRLYMPQLRGIPVPGSKADSLLKSDKGTVNGEALFKVWLANKGIKTSSPKPISPTNLKPTQDLFDKDKLLHMSGVLNNLNSNLYRHILEPIFISKDGYILDGHHRWGAIIIHNLRNKENPLPIIVKVINQDIKPLVLKAKEFTLLFGIYPKEA